MKDLTNRLRFLGSQSFKFQSSPPSPLSILDAPGLVLLMVSGPIFGFLNYIQYVFRMQGDDDVRVRMVLASPLYFLPHPIVFGMPLLQPFLLPSSISMLCPSLRPPHMSEQPACLLYVLVDTPYDVICPLLQTVLSTNVSFPFSIHSEYLGAVCNLGISSIPLLPFTLHQKTPPSSAVGGGAYTPRNTLQASRTSYIMCSTAL